MSHSLLLSGSLMLPLSFCFHQFCATWKTHHKKNEVPGPGSTNCFISASCTQRYFLVFFLPPGRKVLIVYAHQEPKSLNGSLKSIAVEELSKQGCSVTVSDLYAMQFEPRATRNDIVGETNQNTLFSAIMMRQTLTLSVLLH